MCAAPSRLLPEFNPDGLLPSGDYPLTLDELADSILVYGRAEATGWDAPWRLSLVKNLAVLVEQLWSVGITNIYIDGSFTEEKGHPNDIDGYFECGLSDLASGELQKRLNLLDEYKCWTWDPATRRAYRGYPKRQLPMWHRYRVELYPHYGQFCGLTDERGNELQFPSAFRQSRDGCPRGIVQIVRGESPG